MESVLIAVSPLGQPPHPTKGQDENMPSPHTAGFSSRSCQTGAEMSTAGPRPPELGYWQVTPTLLAWLPQGWGSPWHSSVRWVGWGKGGEQKVLSNLPLTHRTSKANCCSLG